MLFVMDSGSILISKNVQLSIRGKVFEWRVVVMVAFDVQDIDKNGEAVNNPSDTL
jgi:hypothetical protein